MHHQNKNNFIIFDTEILKKLNHRQAILYGLIVSMSNKKNYAYLQNSTICEIMNCSIGSVKQDLKTLENMNFIKREVIRNSNNEVVERKIYPMYKMNTEGGYKKDTEGEYKTDTYPKDNICTIYMYNDINIKDIIKVEYLDTLMYWLNYKTEIKNDYKSVKSITVLCNKIQKESTPEQFKQIVETSISNGWKGLFFNNKNYNKETQQTSFKPKFGTLHDD
jgi:hypothetical protein